MLFVLLYSILNLDKKFSFLNKGGTGMSKTKRKGGFFICLIFLIGCIGGIRGDDQVESKIIASGGLIRYLDEENNFDFDYPDSWYVQRFDTGTDNELLLVGFSNFAFDGSLIKDGEISIEIVRYRKEVVDSLKGWVAKKDSGYYLEGSKIDEENDENSLVRSFEFDDFSENWHGGGLQGIVREYYFARGRYVFKFSAFVDFVDIDLLVGFDDMIASLQFEEGENAQ